MDCTPASLLTNANQLFCCLRGTTEIGAARLWLLATIAGTSTDPATLRDNAKCLDCVPIGTLLSIRIYLLTLIAGGSQDPKTLIDNAKCFKRNCFPLGARPVVQVWILTQIAGVSSDASFLIEQSKQIRCCVPRGSFLAIEVYLLCLIAAV